VEINTIRKRLSAVKGGRFAQICAPAQVFSIVLSDILGDPLDMIASGPAYPDSSTCHIGIPDGIHTIRNHMNGMIDGIFGKNLRVVAPGGKGFLQHAAANLSGYHRLSLLF
jgi:hypothetical protein